MIPDKMVEFLHGPQLMFVGTRDEKLRPAASWAFGALADAANDTVTIFVPDIEGETTFRNLEDNGLVALTVTDAATHETYQFKGKCIETRPSSERDHAVQDIYISKVIAHLGPLGYSEEIWNGFVPYPGKAVSFNVEDIFVQTPGPGAGEKLDMSD
jgi:hypothetical protein